MLHRFSRTELMYGKEGMERLYSAKIIIFGIGGVGGYAAEALARSGVGHLTLVDDDRICLTNINRQIYALQSTVGHYKTESAKSRILDINKSATVETYNTFYTPETAAEFDFSQYDYIADAVDTVTAKVELAVRANAAGVPIISCMGAGNKVNASIFEVTDIFSTSECPLARVMRYELKRRNIPSLKVVYSKEKPRKPSGAEEISCKNNCICPPGTKRKCTHRNQIPASNAFVPAAAGLILAGEIVNDITLTNL
jgi:tRNA A37 threonylcarbamoyladenosine dehydratase